tara:strand:- start:39 stop:293 length:255 start_codon:yes stop_codon:yes gene_type:complete
MQRQRNYKKEYKQYHATPLEKKKRASRNKARNAAEKAGLVKKGSSKQVHHKNMNPLDNSSKNLTIIEGRRNARMQPKTKRKRRR